MTIRASIGFMGLGNMGNRMALRLLQAGYPLKVYDRTREKTAEAGRNGATIVDTPRDLALHSDIVMSCVTDYNALRTLFDGPQGAISGAKPSALFIDLSTIGPAEARNLAQDIQAQSAHMVDAAVSGSLPQVTDGSLVIFVGGSKEDFNKAQQVLRNLGQKIFHLGPNGAGVTMKLVVNAILGVEMQAIAEATVLGEKAGLQRELLLDVLEQTAVIAPAHKTKVQNIRQGTFPNNFSLPLMTKDFGLISSMARAYDVPIPVASLTEQLFYAAQAQGYTDDFSEIQRFMEQLAGLNVANKQQK